MSTRIMMRMGKSPFKPMDLLTSEAQDVTGTNSGNMLFAESVYKTLSVDGVTIDRHGYGAHPKRAEYINENYDLLVLPMANNFRIAWRSKLEAYYKLIKKIKIPVAVVGVGVQTDLDYNLDNLAPIDDVSKKLVGAILDRSASIGVRGECTAAYLKKLGFSGASVDVIGCPSMFMYGRDFKVRDKTPITPDSKIAINITSGHKKGCFRDGIDLIVTLADNHVRKYKNSALICQEGRSLSSMLWGGTQEFDGVSEESFRALTEGKRAKFFVDPQTWFSYLEGFDFSFGTRLHGNIAALLAGTPGNILALDSRTLELARFFDIPHMRIDDIDENIDVADIAEKSDFSALLKGHGAHFDNYVRFIKKNGLPCIYDHPAQVENFEKKLERAKEKFAPAAEFSTVEERMSRLSRELIKTRRQLSVTLKKADALEKRVKKVEKASRLRLAKVIGKLFSQKSKKKKRAAA